ncbi:type II toxin-antitoxin system RelE/ParE family toxin [Pseudomonas sp. SP16.1]|uniref:type II toxin-antitoxin system RelE/ParE family toxin n=1 Tax=Pseudomonas sp. SP16.1 TaxID=3458854 RepID=UPI0040454A8F
MKQKQVIPRELANRDVDSAIAYYLEEQAENAALGFIDALERAYKQISRHPASGSTRHAHELDLPGLRSWPLQRYPYLVFYVEQEAHIDVWRVLHEARDIPAWLHRT